MRMGGVPILGVQKAIIAEAGLSRGDELEVVVENDEGPREVEMPEDLAKALRKNAAARRRFESLSYSHQRQHVRYVTEAKKAETRAARIERTIQTLSKEASR